MTRIAIDLDGGDNGPDTIAEGCLAALTRHPHLRFVLYGTELARPAFGTRPALAAAAEFRVCDMAVSMNDKPSVALRQGRRRSTMWRALEAVKQGEADVCVSAGNTGALMAMSRFVLRTMADIDRPAIAAIWPTLRGESVVLDVGANIGADAQTLVDYSVMGAAMTRALFGVECPTVGLLNVGVEEIKGQEEVKEAGRLLRDAKLPTLRYHGFVEGNDIGLGTTDVVVTEGFAGNIALKTAEGTARQIGEYLRSAMSRTLLAKAGYVLAKSAFDRLREKMDPAKVNGGVFLGLNGIVVKSHGSATADGFAAAVEMGADMADNGLVAKIGADLAKFHHRNADLLADAEDGAEADMHGAAEGETSKEAAQ